MKSISLALLIEERARETPDLPFLLDAAGAAITFGAYRDSVARLAGWLASTGVGGDMLVAWQLPTSVEAVTLTGALAWLGVRQSPVLPLYRQRELSSLAVECEPAMLITRSQWRGARGVEIAQAAADAVEKARLGGRPRVLVLDSLPSESTASLPKPADRDSSAVRWIFYTSGTTSAPKGVLHTDDSLGAGAAGLVERYGITAEDRYSMLFPFTHVGGIQMLFMQLMTGASAVMFDRFEGRETFEVVRKLGVTMLSGAGPVTQVAFDVQQEHPDVRVLPKLRLAITGAARKSPTVHYRIKERLGGLGALSCYGLTESPMAVLSSFSDTDEQLAETEGRPISGCHIRIVDDQGSELPTGEAGEILIRGPQMMTGYVNAEASANAFDAQGYFRTGDLGTLDAGGYLRVTGRLKDIINRKGEKISAAEVEEVLERHPAIAEVAAIALPSRASGECCCAVVALRDAASLDLADLAAFCRAEGLATYKIPERLEIIEALPRNASGKVLKPELVGRFSADGGDS